MNWNFIHKYLAGECDPEEKLLVKEWLKKDVRNRKFMRSLEDIWNVTPQKSIEVDAKKAWELFRKERLNIIPENKEDSVEQVRHARMYRMPKQNRRIRYQRIVIKVATIAALVLFTALFYQQIPQVLPNSNTEFAGQIIKTDRGQRTSVNLADGSKITLNAASELTIPAGFPDESRVIYLEGEAYFDVKSNEEKPFIVNSKHTVTRVLGTKFGVRVYNNEDSSQAMVEEGEVLVAFNNGDGVGQEILRKNDLATLSHDAKTTKVKQVDDMQEYLGWINGQLRFHNTSFKEVKQRLERWYDIKLNVEDSVMFEKNLTANFGDESLTEVLNVVALALNWEYDREGSIIVFKSKQ